MWLNIAHRGSVITAVTGASVCALKYSHSQRQVVENSSWFNSKPAAGSKLRFGVITDIQYADVASKGVPERNYRGVLQETADAIDFFNASKEPLAFVAHLGDVIDDYNSTVDDGATSLAALSAVMSRFKKLRSPDAVIDPNVKFLVGNHEVYNFSREQFTHGVETGSGVFKCADATGSTYYSWSPIPTWRMIVLDPYMESIHCGGRGSGLNEEWLQFICERNPNVRAKMEKDGAEARRLGTIQCNYFAGLAGKERRFVPFNGALGTEQRLWLRNELRKAAESGEKAVLLCHVLFHPETSRAPAGNEDQAYCKTVTWDYDEILKILRAPEGRNVVACFHGHQHEGGFHTDEHGIHHIAFEAPLFGPTYAIVEFDEGNLTLRGFPMNREGFPSVVFPGGRSGVECRRVLQLRDIRS